MYLETTAERPVPAGSSFEPRASQRRHRAMPVMTHPRAEAGPAGRGGYMRALGQSLLRLPRGRPPQASARAAAAEAWLSVSARQLRIAALAAASPGKRSEEHTSELQSLMRIS